MKTESDQKKQSEASKEFLSKDQNNWTQTTKGISIYTGPDTISHFHDDGSETEIESNIKIVDDYFSNNQKDSKELPKKDDQEEDWINLGEKPAQALSLKTLSSIIPPDTSKNR